MLSEDQVKELQAKWPRLFRVVVTDENDGAHEVFVRAVTRPEFKRYRKRIGDPNFRDEAVEELLTDCVAYPPPEDFQKLLEALPGACEGISGLAPVRKMLGLSVDTGK